MRQTTFEAEIQLLANSDSDLAANDAISDARHKVFNIDRQLFNCFHMLDQWFDSRTPQPQPRPTVDDLEF